MRPIDADVLLEKAWDADTRIGYVQVVDVGDILDAPTVELEQKGGKEMDDLISRQEALDAIDELVSTMSVCVCVEECRGMNWMKHRAIAAIEALPTAERVGHWVYKKIDEKTGIEYHEFCSECGFPRAQIYDKFCAVCGARMEG